MVLIVAMVMYGPVSEGIGQGFGNLWDLWGQFFGDGNGASAQTVGVGVKLYYADGTIEEFEPKDAYALMPLQVVLGEKEVDAIEFFASCKIVYTGELTNVAITGTMNTHLHPSEVSIRSQPISKTITNPSASGTWFGFADMKVFASEIEDAVPHFGMTSVMAEIEITELKVTLASGETKTFTGNAESGVTVWVLTGTVESVSLQIDSTILFGS